MYLLAGLGRKVAMSKKRKYVAWLQMWVFVCARAQGETRARENRKKIRLQLFCLSSLPFQCANGAEEIGAPRLGPTEAPNIKKVSINVRRTMK